MSKDPNRDAFNRVCLERAHYKCEKCGLKPKYDDELSVHHIISRKSLEITNGGYIKENGITLCDICYARAEAYHIVDRAKATNTWTNAKLDPSYSPEKLFELIGSSKELAISASKKLNKLV